MKKCSYLLIWKVIHLKTAWRRTHNSTQAYKPHAKVRNSRYLSNEWMCERNESISQEMETSAIQQKQRRAWATAYTPDIPKNKYRCRINKIEGVGEIFPKILTSLAKPFNDSLETGIIPVERKLSIILPVYKKGSKNDVANCRPICLASVVCKPQERIAKENILKYLTKQLSS